MFKRILGTAVATLAFAAAANAQDTYSSDTSDSTTTTTTQTTTPTYYAPTAAAPAAEGTTTGELPRVINSSVRIAPVFGASSFAVSESLETDNFGDNFSAGILADFGQGTWAFETGFLTLQADSSSGDNSAAVSVDTWGIPLIAKWNVTGRPHETFFIKAGGMPFIVEGDGSNDVDLMGVAGIGGAIPLGRSSALILDATYNRLFTDGGDLTDYQGITLLGGLSFNM